MCMTLLLSLSGCGKKIKLTTENYSDYISVNGWATDEGTPHAIDIPIQVENEYITMLYPQIKYSVSSKGVSDNYNYEDVIIKVIAKGTYVSCGFLSGDEPTTVPFEKEMILNADISGGARVEEVYDLPPDCITTQQLIDIDFEVVEISGTLVPAN